MIKDEQNLVKALTRFDNEIKIYDDGFGPLWIYRDSMGIRGIVRAMTECDAFDCVLDEILVPESSEDVENNPNDYWICSNFKCQMHQDGYSVDQPWGDLFDVSDGCTVCNSDLYLKEGYHYQPNFTDSGIVATDLNGEALDQLTPEMVAEFEIKLVIEDD